MTADPKALACPNNLTPDGPICPRCGQPRGPSGVDGGSWVHLPTTTAAPRTNASVQPVTADPKALAARLREVTQHLRDTERWMPDGHWETWDAAADALDAAPVAVGVREARDLVVDHLRHTDKWCFADDTDTCSCGAEDRVDALIAAVRAERAPEDEKAFGLRVCEAYGGDPSQVEWHTAEGVASILNEITGIGRANFVEGWNAAMTTAPDEVKAAATRLLADADTFVAATHADDVRALARFVLGGGA